MADNQLQQIKIAVLLAEVERLRAENAAMRPMVARVAEHTAWPNFRADLYMCLFCNAAAGHLSDLQHDANCIAEQARAFVAQHPAEGEAE